MTATFMDIINTAEDARRQEQPATSLNVIVTGKGATAAAHDYARELIRHGFVTKTPVEIGVDGPPFIISQITARVGQGLGEAAKTGVLIINQAERLADYPDIVDRLALACEDKECALVLVCEKSRLPPVMGTELRRHFPVVEADDSIARAHAEEAKAAEQELHKAVEAAVTLQQDVTPMAPLRLAPKPPGK